MHRRPRIEWFRFASALALILLIAIAISAQVRRPLPLRSITIVTEPNATVWLDGVRYGVTDEKGRLAIASVLPGVRALRVRAAGFTEIAKPIPAATRGDVTVALTKTTDEAELAFQSADALTSVDREKAIGEFQRAI